MKKLLLVILSLGLALAVLEAQDGPDPGRSQVFGSLAPIQIDSDAQADLQPELTPMTQSAAVILSLGLALAVLEAQDRPGSGPN
jgi:hypothetical protein